MPDREQEKTVMTQAIETRYFARIRPFATLRKLISNWRRRERLRDLAHLDDHMLNDIGLTRADVTAVLSQPVSIDPLCDLERRVRLRRNRSMPDATRRWLRDRAFAHPRIDKPR
jgi:uncharacterized protein YjiS (DUF1127 family)